MLKPKHGRISPPAIMLITHQIQFIHPCDNVIVLNRGSIFCQGSFLDSIKMNKAAEVSNDFVASMEQFLSKASAESVHDHNIVDALPEKKDEAEKDVKDNGSAELNVEQMGAPEMTSAEGQVTWSTYKNFFSSGITIPVFIILNLLMVRTH
jgi:ABC-type methionine transport system ATPase subunit